MREINSSINFVKYITSYEDDKVTPRYNRLYFDMIEWEETDSGGDAADMFGRYRFKFIINIHQDSMSLRVGLNGTQIVYDGILYENETDFEKLIIRLNMKKIENMLETL